MRLTGAMVLLESLLFMSKAKELAGAQDGAVARATLEFSAAGASTMAAALDVGSMLQEWLLHQASSSGNEAAKAVAQIRLGGFKLAGGTLATVAGVVGAYLDFQDADKAKQENKAALAQLLVVRGAFNALAALTGIGMSLSYSGPLLEYWVDKTGSRLLAFLAEKVGELALRRNMMFATTWILFAAVAMTTYLIALVSDDAIHKWLKRSSFRKLSPPDAQPLYEKQKPEDELTELSNAFLEVTS